MLYNSHNYPVYTVFFLIFRSEKVERLLLGLIK